MEGPGMPSTGSAGSASSPRPLFEITTATDGDVCVIRVEGELDLCQRPRVERALADAEASQASRVLLDLEGLTFIDAKGIETLIAACRHSAGNGDRLRLTSVSGDVARMIRLTGVDGTLPFTDLVGSDLSGQTQSEVA